MINPVGTGRDLSNKIKKIEPRRKVKKIRGKITSNTNYKYRLG